MHIPTCLQGLINPAMTVQDIKETKHYRQQCTQGQHENSIPTTNKVCWGYKELQRIVGKMVSQEDNVFEGILFSL